MKELEVRQRVVKGGGRGITALLHRLHEALAAARVHPLYRAPPAKPRESRDGSRAEATRIPRRRIEAGPLIDEAPVARRHVGALKVGKRRLDIAMVKQGLSHSEPGRARLLWVGHGSHETRIASPLGIEFGVENKVVSADLIKADRAGSPHVVECV